MYKVVIIGAGIVGLSIARVLSMYENLSITVVEKEPDVGWGATKANTSILHPGHEEDPEKHPLRAKLCPEGNRIWRKWVEELDIPAKFPGELMVFFNEYEAKDALKYVELAKKNRVPGVRVIIDRDELKSLEPNISPRALGAVWAPTAGQINPIKAAIALAENAVENGVKILFEYYVTGIKVKSGSVEGVMTNKGFLDADIVINAAGVYADEISRMAGVDRFFIRPRKGQYIVFDPNAEPKVKRILHTMPTPITKGVYVITTTEGNLMIGPTAEDIKDKDDVSTSYDGLEFLWKEASKLVVELPPRSMIIRTFAGIRAEPSTGDFVIEAYDNPWGFINVAGIRSPGLTAAPAIAYMVRDLIRNKLDIKLKQKRFWNPYRKDIIKIRNRNWSEVKELVSKNPLYGWIICRDELVSAAEVIEAVKRIQGIGARITLDGIKFRTWAMMGRCQGSFCRLTIALLLKEYFRIDIGKITFAGPNSNYVIGDIKIIWRRGIRK